MPRAFILSCPGSHIKLRAQFWLCAAVPAPEPPKANSLLSLCYEASLILDFLTSALQNAAEIRWTNNTNHATGSTNDAAVNDTVIYDTKGTASTADDVVVMVLEDYTTTLSMTQFDVV